MLLEAEQIVKSYGTEPVLRGVSFGVTAGEIICLLGPSGCGKSTLLRVIAGLEPDYTGTIRFASRAIDRVPVHERNFGFMFQDFALLPHRRVGQNIAFGLLMQRLSRPVIERRVNEMLELVGLPGYAQRTIFELSGGERQRVALARSLAPHPKLLMLDEPLGSLDLTLRERLTGDLRAIIKSVGLSSIYVTHDQTEAFAVADRILLMDRGQIVQNGTPLEVYCRPASVFAARFLGLNNLFPGRRATDSATSAQRGVWMQTALGALLVSHSEAAINEAALVLIRPEAAEPPTPEAVNLVEGAVVRSTFRGRTQRVLLRHISGSELELDVEAGTFAEGQHVRLALRPDALTTIAASAAD
jgi:ABC-type Fe3+/spermidine/putrescine transport system ATPase subunit